MYNLHLSPEQLEIRDTVREFVTREVKPVVLKADRLDVADRTLPKHLLEEASCLGLRTLALSEDNGGIGADALTSCIVAEELAAGDADIAAVLTETSRLAHIIFDRALPEAERDRLLPGFLEHDGAHLAVADREAGSDTRLGVNYHRPGATTPALAATAAQAGNGDWVITASKTCVANAPVARLFAVTVKVKGRAGDSVLLVPADAPGVIVTPHAKPWPHGTCGDVTFADARVPAGNLLADGAAALLRDTSGRGIPLAQAINIGIGRAAYEAAVDYAHLRIQGGRPLIEHQAIATKLADIAIRLEVSRAAVWQAAWACDHPDAVADRSVSDLPLTTVAQVFVSDAIVKAAKDAAEIFGAMGVMRDMPLQKYLHDARVCQHAGDGNREARLRIAEHIAGYRRAAAAIAAE
ncbi:MAG TPA: acyl-CoA dehydrogenase family protein [Xanthobacteraceae bacterium]|nr:acyl-CoA dehydrogenase family protein [Xanthobacteraceae bacterium]